MWPQAWLIKLPWLTKLTKRWVRLMVASFQSDEAGAMYPTLPPSESANVSEVLHRIADSAHRFLKGIRNLSDQQLIHAARDSAADIQLQPQAAEDVRRLGLILDEIQRAQSRLSNDNAIKAAKARSDKIKQELVASGEVLVSKDFAELAGISRQAVHKGLQAGTYFALQPGGRELYYPAFLADKELRALGLTDALNILADETPWNKWLFFTTQLGSLAGRTPLQALRDRAKEPVLTAARAYRER